MNRRSWSKRAVTAPGPGSLARSVPARAAGLEIGSAEDGATWTQFLRGLVARRLSGWVAS